MAHPNIVFIIADDMGIGDVGCYNADSRIPTPHMDRLATQGMAFSDAHSASAVCTPSRYGILTGRYCWRGHLPYGVLYGYEPPLIEPQRLTVARMLQRAGYHTACVGKWHLGLDYATQPGSDVDLSGPLPWRNADPALEQAIDFSAPVGGGPLELGFDTFFGTSGCATAQPPYAYIDGDRFPEPPSEYREKFHITGRPGMAAPGWRHDDVDPEFTRKAVSYIESRAGVEQPFFLYLAASAPHEPCLEPVVAEHARGQSAAGPRGDMVWLFDWMVGQVMDALDRTGQAEDTLVLVTSDNGALPGDRAQQADGSWEYRTYGHQPSGSWRGWKAHIWEGGHREPLIARWPGHIAAGTRSDQLTCLGDFFATCADITGQTFGDSAGEDSVSMLPALRGDPATDADGAAGPARRDLIHHSSLGVFSIRRDNWKLILDTKGSGGWPPPSGSRPVPGSAGQLYDLEHDPGEQHDRYETEPEIVAELARLIDGQRDAGRSAHPGR